MRPENQNTGPARSGRLAALADVLPLTETLADIGTDHGRLLINLIRAGRIDKGIGVEIARGPYRRAVDNVAACGLADKIDIRLGDGLQPLAPGEATACSIAGLGGGTITDILDRGKSLAADMAWLLLQPMTGAKRLRLYLQQNGWAFEREVLAEDRGIIYQIILTQRGYAPPLEEAEAEFGPLLLRNKPPLLERAIRQRIDKLKDVSGRLDKSEAAASKEKKARFVRQIREWEALI